MGRVSAKRRSLSKLLLTLTFISIHQLTSAQVFQSQSPIPENVANDVPLFDLTTAAPNSTYLITDHSAKAPGMFDVSNGKLILNKTLSTTTRKLFDYEKFKTFNVYVTAASTSNRTDVKNLTIQLTLSNVDDEPPSFTNQPSPFLATVLGNASPGTLVYTLTTNDPDSTSQPTVTITNQVPSSRFTIQPGGTNQFNIVTSGEASFPANIEYTITVSAKDSAGNTQTADVKVLVGLRPPQFFSSPYSGQIYENILDTDRNWLLTKDNQQLEIKVRLFQKDVRFQYQLMDQSLSSQFSQYFLTTAQTSTDPFTQSVKLRSSKIIDYEQLKSMTIVVSAQDITNSLTSTATLNIDVLDENDYTPTFSAPQYSTEVREDLSVGSTVLTVQANDRDSGSNGELMFSILNSVYFNVTTVKSPGTDNNYNGIITVRSPLDYDKPPGPTYNFTLVVTDKGTAPRSASVTVLVSVTNVNDNNPIIDNSTSTLSLTETAQTNFVVTITQASDIDGDSIKFYFANNQGAQVSTIDIFRIDALSGVIQLTSTIPRDKDQYYLNILAVDDDRCCKDKTGQRTSSAVFTINIIDINANKPSFINCTQYDRIASVKEKSLIGTQVIQVIATDPDRGENGRVVYDIQNPSPTVPNAPFKIDSSTGNITVQTVLTRGRDSFIQVTVVGRNPTPTQMEGWCTFRVTIVDINDHPPTFSQTLYNIEIAISTPRFSTIRQMVASDDDVGVNAEITYTIGTNDSTINSLFSIDPNTGVIKLIGDLTTLGQATKYNFTVIATDHGTDPGPLSGNTTVVIDVKLNDRKPPEWINLPNSLVYSISESAPAGTVLATFSCNSNIPDTPNVEFLVFEPALSITQDSSTFSFVQLNVNSMNLVLKSATALDYSTKKQYQLSVVCQTLSGLTLRVEINPVVNVLDANNQVPTFEGLSSNSRYVGSVAENSPAGATVLQISASDRDETPAFRTVTFQLLGPNKDLFQINYNGDNRATIVTSGSINLDREMNEFYTVEIEARDGAPAAFPPNSTLPNIARRSLDVRVTDVNDNVPSFANQSYTFELDEETPVGFVLASLTANDPDSSDQGNLNYRFETGNTNNAFSILNGAGQIRVARRLDYENQLEPKMYRMLLIATDSNQLHSCNTTVEIKIRDINDNSPEFSQLSYSVVGMVVEEDSTVTPTNRKFLIQVSATDKDISRNQTDIRYSLLGDNNLFVINETSGEIYLIGKLDRDRPNPNYTFTARAQDERSDPRYGYATVEVSPLDINDNSPVFLDNYLKGDLYENPAVGTRVLTVLARDIDYSENGTVNYRISSTQPTLDRSALFSVSNIGVITTIGNPGDFDRETVSIMYLVVDAFDGGKEQRVTTATVTINILDVNDNSPYFENSLYTVTISEATKFGSILLVTATDLDYDLKNKDLRFQLTGPQSNNFIVVGLISPDKQVADIQVKTPVDYERDPHNFTFTLHVDDRQPGHENSTQIQVFVTDYNDNPPIFKENTITVSLEEERPPGEVIATFTATDADEGINAEFEYSIVRASDPRYEFYIDPHSGQVTTRKRLDREVAEYMEVVIMAKDKGEIPLNSTALLKITLIDINDNAPSFLEDYRPQVRENVANNNFLVQEIFAKDPDKNYGPPFGFLFSDRCNDCANFRLTENTAGNGSARITTSTTFDREAQKYYYLSIVMWDLRGTSANNSMTATNTLTVVIGDENDNNMKPGNQDIFVYNYEGDFSDVEIGRVYTDDPDDWDLPDKTFSNLQPTTMQKYFNVSATTGMITMKSGVPVNGADPPYMFKVDVYDKKFNSRVTCTVSVTVMELSDEAVRKSGSIKLSGITAEEFVKQTGSGTTASSPYDRFRQKVANILGYPSKDNVEIVSLTDVEGDLDIRYSAHSSPYLNPSQLESAVLLNLDTFEKDVGVQVAQVPINLCTNELYDDGCYTNFNFDGQPRLINANGTSYLVMDTTMTAESGCVDSMFPDPVECRGDYCYNGGTCSKDDWGKLSCQCSPGFDGPRCQQRRHQFDGSSIAFYDSLAVCSEGRTSIDLITTQDDGLIMYSGAIVGSTQEEAPKDFISLELKGGYPILKLNLGSDEISVTLTGKDKNGQTRMSKLSDGKWHTIHIDRTKQQVTLTVDHCEAAAANTSDGLVSDWSPCTVTDIVPGPDILLNVQSFLQLGGRYQGSTTKFNGCLRNLFHNTKLYDLYYRNIPNWKSGSNGCSKEEVICGQNTAQPVCGEHATCNSLWLPNPQVASCRCDPGWYGEKCAKEAPTYDLKSQSFFKWNVGNTAIEQALRKMSLQMMFRTRQKTGTLLVLTNAPQNVIILQLEAGKLTVRYDLGKGEKKLVLETAPANTGQWHTVRMERYGSEFILSMDGGEGRYYRYQVALPDLSVFFRMLSYISAGARVQPVSGLPENNQIIDDLINTCVRDIRLNDIWLPLATAQNSEAAGITLHQSRNVVEGCTRDDCSTPTCSINMVCFPLWEDYECRCATGFYMGAGGVCVSVCTPGPCLNNGVCTVVSGEATCSCVNGWTGKYCNQMAIETANDLSDGAIAGIVIAILVLLALLIAIIVFLCIRRKPEKEKYIMEVDPDDDYIRENVMFYDEEGAGEEDHNAYDLKVLTKPAMESSARPNQYPDRTDEKKRRNAPSEEVFAQPSQLERPDVGSFIKHRIQDTENDDDPFGDSTHQFNFEGSNSDAGSLSSLNTSTSGGSQDYDYLSDWGPKFAKLADMYGAGQNLDDES